MLKLLLRSKDSHNKENVYFPYLLYYSDIFVSDVRSSPPEVFLGKGVLKICSKFTGEHPYRSAISIKLLCIGIGVLL